MKRTIAVQGRELTYVLTGKKVKNINLRVKPGGEVTVSAPRRMSGAQVDELVRERAAWIFAALARLERTRGQLRLCDGGRIPVRGEELAVRVAEGRPQGAVRTGNLLLVTVAPQAPRETAGREIRNWLADEARGELPALFSRCWSLYSGMTGCAGPQAPALTLRWMVSRWGSCTVRSHKITLNFALICLPPQSAAYVVLHELAHFRHPDHSPAFHALVARLLEAAGLPEEARLRQGMKVNLRELVRG